MVLTLVPVTSRPWRTSGDVNRSVTRLPCGTAMQRGTNINCVATTRAVAVPSLSILVPRLCSANSPDRCRALGSIRSTLLGGFTPIVRAVKITMLSVAAISTPTPNAHRISVHRIRRSCISGCRLDMISPHNTTRNEYQQVNHQVSHNQHRNRCSSHHSGPKRDQTHDFGQSSFINLVC